MKVLLSIKSEFVREILKGTKKFEYRKRVFSRDDITSVIIYETMPSGMIIAEFTIDKILTMSPNDLWKKTRNQSGISKDFFDEYFSGREMAHALKIGKLKTFMEPIDPKEIWSDFTAPQSYKYVSEEDFCF